MLLLWIKLNITKQKKNVTNVLYVPFVAFLVCVSASSPPLSTFICTVPRSHFASFFPYALLPASF